MGGKQGKSEKHMMHYHRSDENKLWLYLPNREVFRCYPCFMKDTPFFFGAVETISVPPLGAIFIAGGLWADQGYASSQVMISHVPGESNQAAEIKDAFKKIVEGTHYDMLRDDSNFAKSKLTNDMLVPTNLTAMIPVGNIKNFNGQGLSRLEVDRECCEQLMKPRHSHVMLFRDPYIYLVGGVQDNQPTRNCKKFHVYDKMWCDISIMPSGGTLNQPGLIDVENFMYVFDSFSEEQQIFKYNFNYDVWHMVPFKTNDFKVPRSVGPCVFRLNQNELVYLNGRTENRDHQANFYVIDLDKDLFTQERSDKKLLDVTKDRQGVRDYTSGETLFYQLNDRNVKVMHKNNFNWDSLEISLIKVTKEKFSVKNLAQCCTKR